MYKKDSEISVYMNETSVFLTFTNIDFQNNTKIGL